MNSTIDRCPGFNTKKKLKAFLCKCPKCGTEKEIFSDELDQTHICSNCKSKIDIKSCKFQNGI